MQRLLEGVTVLEVANVITGPLAGNLLADLGADVIKVEAPPHGDSMRVWEGTDAGVRPTFAAFNRGKRSIGLDIRQDVGRDVFLRMVGRADAVIENFRPGSMDRRDMGWERLRAANPRLVYCHITGMGYVGPEADRPTFDAVAQALSGLWSQFGDLDDPVPVGPAMADQLTGIYAALAVLAGLQHVATTGEGVRLEVNMLAACLAFQAPAVATVLNGGRSPDKASRAPFSQAYGVVCSDGLPLAIHLSTPQKFWEGLCRTVDRPDLVAEPRFRTKAERIRNYGELAEILKDAFAARPRSEWLSMLQANGVPCAPILTLAEALQHPQTQALRIIDVDANDPRQRGLVRSPVAVEGRHFSSEQPAPRFGEHTDAILDELGVPRELRSQLLTEGTIG